MEIRTPPTHELQLISQYYGENLSSIPTFLRVLRYGREILFSVKYSRVTVRNSFTVEYYSNHDQCSSYGQILYFVCLNDQPAAVIKKFNAGCVPDDFHPVRIIIPVESSPTIEIIDVNNIEEKCIFVQISDTVMYVIKFPDALDVD